MGWLRDILKLAASQDGRIIAREVADLLRLQAQVRQKLAQGPTTDDLVSYDAQAAIDSVLDAAAVARGRLKRSTGAP